VAAFLPGDAVTLILETVPLYILYEISILVASLVARRDAKRGRAEAVGVEELRGGTSDPGSETGPSPSPGGGPGQPPESSSAGTDDELEPSVKQIIDHIDRELS
jgi:hypothetical protein